MKHIAKSTWNNSVRGARIARRQIARRQIAMLRKPCIGAVLAMLLVCNVPLRAPAQTLNPQTPDSQNSKPQTPHSQTPNPQTQNPQTANPQNAPASSPSPTQQNPPSTQTPNLQTPSQQSAPAQNSNPQNAAANVPHAQNPIAVDVNLVTMLATVRDKHGKLINNLTKEDFALQQDGHAQTIKYFDKETNLPLTLGLLVDTSMSQRRVLDQEKAASRTFVDHVLREDRDKAFLIHFDREVELLQELTNSRQKLEAALEQVGAPQFSQTSSSGGGSTDPDGDGGGRGGRGGGRGMHGGGTVLYDAIYLAADEVMKKQPGRKAVIVLTDGVDRGSKVSLQEAIATAQRADTEVYSILFADKEGNGGHDRDHGGFGGPRIGGGGMGRGGGGYPRRTEEPRPDGKKILEQISRETGGRFFEVTKKQTVDQIYTEIDEELRNQYSLGYTPEKADASSGYHKIQLTVKQKDLLVQTREGYYAGQ